MKNKKIIILIILFSLIILSPKTIDILKSNMKKEKYNINEGKNLSIEYSSNMELLQYKKGFLMYDGKSLNYIDNNAERIFSLNVRIEDYSIDTNNSYIYLLDKTKKEVYIIDKNGGLIKKTILNEKPISVKALSNGSFLVHYSTNVDVEGIKIIEINGEIIKDISIPKITINYINVDSYTDGFLVSGISNQKDTLINSIFYYDKKGNLLFSDNIENKLFIKSIFSEDNIISIEPKYIEIRDKNFKISNRLNLDYSIKDAGFIDDKIGIIYDSEKFSYININGQENGTDYPIQNVKGFVQVGDEYVLYSDRSIYFTKHKQEYNLTQDIVKIIALENNDLIIEFRGSIKFLNLD